MSRSTPSLIPAIADAGRSISRKRKRNAPLLGISARQYQVLLILNSYGWCSHETLRGIAAFHHISFGRSWIHEILSDLRRAGYVIASRSLKGTKVAVFAVSASGLAYITGRGDHLVCDTNVLNDPSSLSHLTAINQIMLQFVSLFRTRYWLTDYQVRADNMDRGKDGLAKDYDGVTEIVLQNSVVRIGIEYELTQKSTAKYEKLCNAFLTEKYLHVVIYFLNSSQLLESIARHFCKLGGLVCFVILRNYLLDGVETQAFYWFDDELRTAPLRDFLIHVGRRVKPAYEPMRPFRLDAGL